MAVTVRFYPRTGFAKLWVRTLLKQLLLLPCPDRSYRTSRHVPGLSDRGHHVPGVPPLSTSLCSVTSPNILTSPYMRSTSQFCSCRSLDTLPADVHAICPLANQVASKTLSTQLPYSLLYGT